jgi:hypothetical protein
MSSHREHGSHGLVVTKTDYGVSISIKDRDPATRYLPPDPRELAKAVRNAKTESPSGSK